MTRQTYKIVALSRALSPITHNATTSGNEAVIARIGTMTPNGVRDMPWLSGNAIRGVMVRGAGGEHLIDACGWAGVMNKDQLNFILHGGKVEAGTVMRSDTARQADVRRVSPLLSILGGCLPNQMLHGDLKNWHGALVCRENEPYLREVLSEACPKGLRPAEQFIDHLTYYRRDIEHGQGHLLKSTVSGDALFADSGPVDPKDKTGDTRGIYAGECVIPGAMFAHGFDLVRVTETEVGALLHSLACWQANGGIIGGQGGKGHGRLATTIMVTPSVDQARLVALYDDHVRTHAAELTGKMAEWFAAPPKKPAKGKAVADAT